MEHDIRHPEQQTASELWWVAPSGNGKGNFKSSLGSDSGTRL